MDEVEVHTNPKVGCMWMRRGEQAAVPTPGTDERRVLAGSLHWRTGRAFLTEGLPDEGRTAALFCRHLDDLRRALRHYRVIHVVCDNARTHKPEGSRLVKGYLREWGGRVVIHYLPVYAPECNPVERVWWRLHEAVTRNHRCPSMEELLALTFAWLEERRYFRVRSTVYAEKPHKRDSLPRVRGTIWTGGTLVGRCCHRDAGSNPSSRFPVRPLSVGWGHTSASISSVLKSKAGSAERSLSIATKQNGRPPSWGFTVRITVPVSPV
jgi:transposase